MPVKTKLITHRQAASEDHAKNCDNNEEYVSSTPEVNTNLARLCVNDHFQLNSSYVVRFSHKIHEK